MEKFSFDKYKNLGFFIIGVQRSGTTLLRLLLNEHSEIGIPEEAGFLMPFITKGLLKERSLNKNRRDKIAAYLIQNEQYARWKIQHGTTKKVLSQHKTMREIIVALYYTSQKGISDELPTIVGDKTPSFIRKVDLLATSFPDAKFIHIVRDGRDPMCI